jgi:hypothetical protein
MFTLCSSVLNQKRWCHLYHIKTAFFYQNINEFRQNETITIPCYIWLPKINQLQPLRQKKSITK